MYVIAEVGCNHMGDLEIAQQMVEVAAKHCKVWGVKFQKRDVKQCLTAEQYDAPHPVPENSYGKTYGEHREFLEFTQEDHYLLKVLSRKLGVRYGVSVWDINSFKAMSEIEPDFIKIPSAKNNNWELMLAAVGYLGDLYISLGMTTRKEEDEIRRLVMEREKRGLHTVMFACTSGYPVAFEDVCLGEIARLQKKYSGIPIGYSGHHLGIAVDVAAMALGAHYIERHFTLDRTWRGTDHAASLEPDGMRKLVRDLEHVNLALNCKPEHGFLDCEVVQRRKLKC